MDVKTAIALAAVLASGLIQAKVEMGTPFSDRAVLQRGVEVPVWGTAEPGARVTVAFAGAEVAADAGADGNWSLRLPPMEASSENRTMMVTERAGGTETDRVAIADVLVGEVWFASGQSNMECPIWGGDTRYRDGAGALVTAMDHLPNIRFAKNIHAWSAVPARAKSQGWARFEPQSFTNRYVLSAVAYYYARELYLALGGVPVGIVDASWGGTNIDAWTPRCGYDGCDESIRATAEFPVAARWDASMKKGPVNAAQQQPTVLFNGMVDSWAPMAMRGFIWYQGCHNSGESELYCAKLHALYTNRYVLSAVAYYYARELYLALGGVPVGIVDASWGGTNIDAWTPRCGYDGCDESIRATAEFPVAARWDASMKKGPVNAAQQQPTVLFNGMVDSWAPMAMRGFIWYQGCHNSGESELYCAKLHALYNGWCRRFANSGLKIYLAQLAPYTQNWLGICTAQNRFCAEEPNAALAVTADVGNFFDIHPNRKEIVAKRLAVHALKRDYGFDIEEDDSPVFETARRIEDGAVEMTFNHVKSWYVYSPDRSIEPAFEVAGEDGEWKSAKLLNVARGGYVTGVELVVKSADVPVPVKVRYLVRPRTMGTVYNQMSLPLGPFSADVGP